MPECDCGNQIESKNSAGHWRDKCQDCLSDIADSRTPHLADCAENECPICHSRLMEIKGVVKPLYLRTLLERPQERENETLDTYD